MLAAVSGLRRACRTLGASRATMQRRQHPVGHPKPSSRRSSPRRLAEDERAAIWMVTHSERFCDRSVREIYATLLDEGTYLGSISTFYRILQAAGETRERRALATHPTMLKPELAATAPHEVWSWDITKLLGPQKWTYYYLYVVLDVFSRYVVAWRLEMRESAQLAEELFGAAIVRENVNPTALTVHADGGSAMTSKSLAHLFADLGVTRSRSRSHVSNDNPYIESHFKTLKYGPSFPGHFANIEQARDFCRRFFAWYNVEHRHSGIALLTPEDVHRGRVDDRRGARRSVLHAAFERHPERFVLGRPEPPAIADVKLPRFRGVLPTCGEGAHDAKVSPCLPA
jgi:putative transposase